MSWRPPTKVAQRTALSVRTAPKDLLPWLRLESFPPIEEPGEDDWGRGSGQSFDMYTKSRSRMATVEPSRRPTLPVRHRMYLQPLGDAADSASFPCLDTLAAGCTAFYGLQCIVLPMISLRQLEAAGRKPIRTRRKGAQVNASDINANLIARLPADGYTLCAVTMRDVWKGDFNYLFGLAFLSSGVGVFSLYLISPTCPNANSITAASSASRAMRP